MAREEQSVTESVLGDMFGLHVDKQPAPELPKDQGWFCSSQNSFDGSGEFPVLALAFTFLLDIFFWVYANVSGNILGLVGVIAGSHHYVVCVTQGKRFSRFASGIHVIDLDRKCNLSFANPTREKHLSFLIPRLKAQTHSTGARRSASVS